MNRANHFEKYIHAKLASNPILHTFLGGFCLLLIPSALWFFFAFFPSTFEFFYFTFLALIVIGILAFMVFFVSDILSFFKGGMKDRTTLQSIHRELKNENKILSEIEQELKGIERILQREK